MISYLKLKKRKSWESVNFAYRKGKILGPQAGWLAFALILKSIKIYSYQHHSRFLLQIGQVSDAEKVFSNRLVLVEEGDPGRFNVMHNVTMKFIYLLMFNVCKPVYLYTFGKTVVSVKWLVKWPRN